MCPGAHRPGSRSPPQHREDGARRSRGPPVGSDPDPHRPALRLGDVRCADAGPGHAHADHVVGRGSPSLQASKILSAPDLVGRRRRRGSRLAVALGSAQLEVPAGPRRVRPARLQSHEYRGLNRVLTDHIADRLFTHCDDADDRGDRRAGIRSGNTMIDSLVQVEADVRGGRRRAAGPVIGPRSSTAPRPPSSEFAPPLGSLPSCFRSIRGPAQRSRPSSSALTYGCWSRWATWSSARSTRQCMLTELGGRRRFSVCRASRSRRPSGRSRSRTAPTRCRFRVSPTCAECSSTAGIHPIKSRCGWARGHGAAAVLAAAAATDSEMMPPSSR